MDESEVTFTQQIFRLGFQDVFFCVYVDLFWMLERQSSLKPNVQRAVFGVPAVLMHFQPLFTSFVQLKRASIKELFQLPFVFLSSSFFITTKVRFHQFWLAGVVLFVGSSCLLYKA